MIRSLSLILISLLFFSSCSSYIAKMHRSFDRADGKSAPKQRHDKFAMYRNKRRPISPQKNMLNSRSRPYMAPTVKRKYSNPEAKQRYKANDLNDNSDGGSLWSGTQGRNNFLFTQDNSKQNGDIVLINVFGKLKNEITAELKRAFPTPKKKAKKDAKKGGEGAPPAAAAAPAQEPNEEVSTQDGKVHDRISSVIVEEINKDHLLLRGRKYLLYRNRKRMVEVQALVSRRDVLDDDTISSDKIIESNINVVR